MVGTAGPRLIDSGTCRDNGRERIRFGGTGLDVGGKIDDRRWGFISLQRGGGCTAGTNSKCQLVDGGATMGVGGEGGSS